MYWLYLPTACIGPEKLHQLLFLLIIIDYCFAWYCYLWATDLFPMSLPTETSPFRVKSKHFMCCRSCIYTMLSSGTMWTDQNYNATSVYSQRTIGKKWLLLANRLRTCTIYWGKPTLPTISTPQAGRHAESINTNTFQGPLPEEVSHSRYCHHSSCATMEARHLP